MKNAQIQYLPALPDLIEIDMTGLYANDGEPGDDEPQDNVFEEFQMRAELTALRENMQRKNQRMRNLMGD